MAANHMHVGAAQYSHLKGEPTEIRHLPWYQTDLDEWGWHSEALPKPGAVPLPPSEARRVSSTWEFSTRDAKCEFLSRGGWGVFPEAVIVRVDVRDISKVDVVEGTFVMSAYVDVFFYDAELVSQLAAGQEPSEAYLPKLKFRNLRDGENLFIETAKSPSLDEAPEGSHAPGCLTTLWPVFNAEFSQSFDLHQFPFDIQSLTVFVALTGLDDRPGSVLLPVAGLMNLASSLPEWEVLAPSIQVFNKAGPDPPLLAFNIYLKRRWMWFALNHMAIVGMLASCCFAAFHMPPTDLGGRLGVTLTLLLTVTAAKLALSDSLPKVSYLTVLDRYQLSCFFLIFLVLLENVVVVNLQGDPDWEFTGWKRLHSIEQVDFASAMALLAAWLLFHVILVLRVRCRLVAIDSNYGKPWDLLPLSIPREALATTASTLTHVL